MYNILKDNKIYGKDAKFCLWLNNESLISIPAFSLKQNWEVNMDDVYMKSCHYTYMYHIPNCSISIIKRRDSLPKFDEI